MLALRLGGRLRGRQTRAALASCYPRCVNARKRRHRPVPAGRPSAKTREAFTPVPSAAPGRTGRLRRFLLTGSRPAEPGQEARVWPWYKVLWLTGVDYFSTLGYQPGIAFLAAGVLSPIASALLVLATLGGALPTYMAVARRSYIGQGSIAMLERLLHGWWSKLFVLLLLGFATTAFVITMTLSAADAALHAVENPLLKPLLGDHRTLLTVGLLAALAVLFLSGAREVIGVAMAVGVPYILINAVVLARSLWEIAYRPDLWERFSLELAAQGDVTGILLASMVVFPKLALGLSGFETGVAVMPLVKSEARPGKDFIRGRVRATRKLLATAAGIMSAMLIASSFSTTVLIPAAELQPGGAANGRALAFLAHGLLGRGFGSVYDFLTILILWFAGSSAMAGLLTLIPRYLPRFGMAPQWVAERRPLVLLLFVATLAVTLAFDAEVDAQAGAYATGVLVLILSAAVAVALATWREARTGRHPDGRRGAPRRKPFVSLYFWLISAVFAFALIDNVVERPDGVIIAGLFCLAILVASALSRYRRALELRVDALSFANARSEQIWEAAKDKKVSLVPLRTASPKARHAKAREIRRYYNTRGPLAFLHIDLRDDRSEFNTALRVRVEKAVADGEGCLIIHVSGAVAIANTIAYVSEQLDPLALFLGLTRGNKMAQAVKYVLFGEGETGLLVFDVLRRHWASTPGHHVRPLVFLMSE